MSNLAPLGPEFQTILNGREESKEANALFKKGDYIVNIVNISQGVDIVYFIVKVHKKEKNIQLYDIINIKNKMVYHRVHLPDDFYLKLERTIKLPEEDI